MMIPKLALTYEEAAEATGYSVKTLRWAVRRNDLMARYANSRPVFRVSELDEWLASLPTEPRGGHARISHVEPDAEPWIPPKAEPERKPSTQPTFRTPEQVASELGLGKSTVRSFSRISGIYTRVGRRNMLTKEDVDRLVIWISARQAQDREEARKHDPFA